MNLCLPGKPVDVLHTGTWTAKAIGELKKASSTISQPPPNRKKFARLPRCGRNEILPRTPPYVHICTNNTIEGTQWTTLPETGNVPLVADMSSDIAARPIDVKKYGVIFAGAQKNLGPSGVTVVMVRKDLAERADKESSHASAVPHAYQGEVALSHAPDVRGLHRRPGIGMDRIEGGIPGIEKRNGAKARLLYGHHRIERRILFLPRRKSLALKNERSLPRRGGDDSIERKFATEAAAARLCGHPRAPLRRRDARVALQTLLPLKPWKP